MKVFWRSCMLCEKIEVYRFSITMRYFTFKRIENALKEHGCFPWGKAHNPIEVRKGQYDPETKTIVLHFWVCQGLIVYDSDPDSHVYYIDSSRDETCREAISLIGLAAQYERITEETLSSFYDHCEKGWDRILNFSDFH